MSYAWRATTLILEDSHIYQRGKVLRHPTTKEIVIAARSKKSALDYCRLNGYTWMLPVKDVDQDRLEARI